MPEVVTKYPESLIKELKDAGGKCGVGAPQTILTKCPKDKFCLLPTGEICVYDLPAISTMTQIRPADWLEVTTGIPGMFGCTNLIIMMVVFAVGLAAGVFLSLPKKSKK